MEDLIEAKRLEIVAGMKALRRKLECNDDSEILVWVIPSVLACAHRPLRHHPHYGGSGLPIPGEAQPIILDWVEQIRLEGIVSIVSFMHDRDLRCYREIDLGGLNLLEFFEKQGFHVCPLPWEDPAHSKTAPAVKRAKLERVRKDGLEAHDRLPKPVLLQCSAGIDRSAPVAAYIWQKRATYAWAVEQPLAGDGEQPALVPRFGFWQQVSDSVSRTTSPARGRPWRHT